MNAAFTTAARAAVIAGYTIYTSVDLMQSGSVVEENIALDEDAQPTVDVDGTAAVRRRFTATLADPLKYAPLTASSRLSPFLTECVVYSGVRYPDGNYDRWPVFTGGLEDPRINDTDTDVLLTITASDRAYDIGQRLLPDLYTIASGTDVTTAIENLITSVRPGINFVTSSPVAATTLPTTVFPEMTDPWQACMGLAAAYGMEVFFDGSGNCVIRPIPDPDTQPVVWTFVEGDTATIGAVDVTITAKDSASHAIALGQALNGSAPIRSDQYDNDASSPTYYLGSFGDRPAKVQSDVITTQAQADAAALALLSRKKGANQIVTFTTAPITALDEYDVVTVQRSRMGLNDSFSLEKFQLPLYPGGVMAPACRSRQV